MHAKAIVKGIEPLKQEPGLRSVARATAAESGTVATLLPLTAFALREPFAPARKFIDSGAAVALATDLNPFPVYPWYIEYF